MSERIVAYYIRDTGYGPSAHEQRRAIEPILATLSAPTEELLESQEAASVFANLRARAGTGTISTVVVASLDRLDTVASSLPVFLSFVGELAAGGARFISIAEGLDSGGSAMEFMARARDFVEQAARVIGGERIHWALKRAKDQGQPVGRKRGVDYDQIIALRQEGKTEQEIADILGVSRGSVQHCLRQFAHLD